MAGFISFHPPHCQLVIELDLLGGVSKEILLPVSVRD
jgi:hypothetical protein